MFYSDKIFGISKTDNVNETPDTTFDVKGKNFVFWGNNNNYPEEAMAAIGRTGVLNTAIGFKARMSFGQGVVPMDVKGYDENGDAIIEPCNDEEVQHYVHSRSFREYITAAFRDIFKFGNCFPIFYFNENGTKIVRLLLRNARHCRVSDDKQWLCVYKDFHKGTPGDKDCQLIYMLDEDDPFYDLERLRLSGKLKGQPIAFPRIKNFYCNNDFYGIPDWNAAWKSGWVDIANKIPLFLKSAYANAMTMMWHVQVPASFWEMKFPKNEYPNKAERAEAINNFMDKMEDNLCGEENSNKTFFTDYTTGVSGKSEEKWVIERLENEIDAKERLSTSAAANSEILFSMMLNPSVLGAGMPGGAYAGNAGSGSDIRESFLVSVITTYIEKQQVLDPVYMMLRYNGHGEDLVLKYKETILTTLNTGQAKEEITT